MGNIFQGLCWYAEPCKTITGNTCFKIVLRTVPGSFLDIQDETMYIKTSYDNKIVSRMFMF